MVKAQFGEEAGGARPHLEHGLCATGKNHGGGEDRSLRHLRQVTRSGLLGAGAVLFFLLASTALAVDCESNPPSTSAPVPTEASSPAASTAASSLATMLAPHEGSPV